MRAGFTGQDLRNGNNPLFHNRANGGDTRIPRIINVRAIDVYDNRDLQTVTSY